MNRLIVIIFLTVLLFSCSLNSGSSFWSKRNINDDQKIVNIKQISKKDEILLKEINKNLEINVSNLKKENFSLRYFDNNLGKTNYNGELKSISRFKFSKIKKFNEYEPEIILHDNNVFFF